MSDLIAQMLAGVPDFEGARCAEVDPELFFPERGKPNNSPIAAKAICATCPHIDPCREYAIASGERDGIWGGVSANSLYRARAEEKRAAS